MAPEINWGFSASVKADDLERRLDRVERLLALIHDEPIESGWSSRPKIRDILYQISSERRGKQRKESAA
jgi:hypothetical protein